MDEATEPTSVDRVPAWLVAASAVRSPSVRSTPIPARRTPQCHRNTRYGSILPITEVLPSGRMNSVVNRSGRCPGRIRTRPKSHRAPAMGCAKRSENSSAQGMWPRWNSEGCEPLPARSPPSCRARFGFRAEVPFAPRLTDARTFIVAITGDMVDASPAVVADVALDTAGTPITCGDARRLPGGGLQAIAPAPVPWRNELSSPHAAPRRFRRRLLVDVRPRVLTVGQRPTFSDQPGVDVLPALPAHGNDAPIPITIALFASDRAIVDSPGKRLRRLAPARPGAAPCHTVLRALGCIHAKETDPRRADIDRVPVDHPRAPRQIRLNRLASSALGATATSIRSDSRIACPHCHRRAAVREDFEGLHHHSPCPMQSRLRYCDEYHG